MNVVNAKKVRAANLNMAIARTHEFTIQMVALIMSFGNLLAIALSICSLVGGTVTLTAMAFPGNYGMLILAGAVGAAISALTESLTIGSLIRLRLANKRIREITVRLEDETGFHAWRKRLRLTRAYRQERRQSLATALVGVTISAVGGGIFYHTILAFLPLIANIAVSGLFAFVISVTFVANEVFKDRQEEAIREGFLGGSLIDTAIREEVRRQSNKEIYTELIAYMSSPEAKAEIHKSAHKELLVILQGMSAKTTEETSNSGQVAMPKDDNQHDTVTLETRQSDTANREENDVSGDDILALLSYDKMTPLGDDNEDARDTPNEVPSVTPKDTTQNAKERDTEPLKATRAKGKRTSRQAAPKDDFATKVTKYQERHPEHTLSQIAQHFGVSIRTIQRRLSVTA